ncbi:MAG: hypothetical protein HZY76_09555 [Anaerolineae bacterium]|nr:MAG: hypothetical protein HZY76_09555 [Anaerolineae bacterium]
MNLDLVPYLEPFDLTSKQIERIDRLLTSRLHWWGIDDTDLALRVAIIAAPGQLTKLSPEAFELLERCQNRVWAFHNKPDDHFGISRRTFGQLFCLLLKLDLIVEGNTRQKLSSSKKVTQLRSLL